MNSFQYAFVPVSNYRQQFFGVFSAFSLSFWYGSKAVLEGNINDVGTIIV